MRKIETALTTLFLLLVCSSIFFTRQIRAQIPNREVECDETDNPEFHSLRPYQKSPCKKEVSDTARFCGNRLVLTDSITVSPKVANECTSLGGGRTRCSFSIKNKAASYAIDLSEAELPILGNTEQVANSQNPTDELDDAAKTNEYVSWYLNGVINRAEYGPLTDSAEDISKIVDFSGPIKKLLPQAIQHGYQIATFEKRNTERHDQIVACVDQPFLKIGSPTLIPCYEGDGSNAQHTALRLSHWDGDNGPFNQILDRAVNLLTAILPEIPRSAIRQYIGTPWTLRIPPLPWGKDMEGHDFTETTYNKAYNEWRGKSCLLLPVINKLICVENPIIENEYANLFPYIPFSSTEDRVGEVSVSEKNVSAASEELSISNVSLNTTPAKLFFSHTEEVNDLAGILQLTFVPKDNPTTGAPSLVSPAESCDLTYVRTNEGDALFAETITGNLSYDADFTCEFDTNAKSPKCTKDVSVGLGVVTETPKADELWSRLVAGPAGIFKRIFPLVGEGSAIVGILDMPGSTNVTYSGSGLVSAGNPGARSGEEAELYFSHLGGISEYFLKGIQTILRPKGYGEQILSGAAGTFASSGETNCNQSSPEVSLPGTLSKSEFFQLALNWVGGQAGNHVMECYNDVIARAQSAGINPTLALWTWLQESAASNYDWAQLDLDFGVTNASSQNFVAQIEGFIRTARAYDRNNSICAGRSVNDMQAYAYIYSTGTCDPSTPIAGHPDQTAGTYYQSMVEGFSIISPGCSFPNSTTDTGCH